MIFWFVIGTLLLGVGVLCQALKQSYEQWYYGRLNRRTLARWRKEADPYG